MSRFLDTSVLVPVFLTDHPHHLASLALFAQCEPATSSCASHTLAELYSTLTRLPLPHRATPAQAFKSVEQTASRHRLISLDGDAHLIAIRRAAANNISGGNIYDFLLAACALESGADIIYSWNVRHFERFGLEVAGRLSTPPL